MAPDRPEIARTRERSAALPRELRLTDLVLLQVLLIVGLPWIGYAAKLGGAHVGLWFLAIVLFYFPLAATVIFLSRRLPLEGGIYQWAKLGISPFAGFQTAWNYSFFLILIYAASGSVVANNLSYIFGPRAAWMSSSKPLILASSVVFFALVYAVNVRGLHLARWVTDAGGALVLGLYLLIAGLLFYRLWRGQAMAQPPFALALPAVSLITVNLFSKIAFNALSGFEQVAIFAGECHTPERRLRLPSRNRERALLRRTCGRLRKRMGLHPFRPTRRRIAAVFDIRIKCSDEFGPQLVSLGAALE